MEFIKNAALLVAMMTIFFWYLTQAVRVIRAVQLDAAEHQKGEKYENGN